MKKIVKLYLLIITSFATISCNDYSYKTKLAEEAYNGVKLLLYEIAKDPNSIQISNMNTVFNNDSLCILHVNFKAKNGIGLDITSKIEYIYINFQDKKYEAYKEIESDSIYQDKQTFERNKKGKIYEELSYENALFYRAVILANTEGRVVGDKHREQEVNIPIPTGTGFWEVYSYKDEFGDESFDKYLVLTGKGSFSNSATTGSKMTSYLYIDSKDIAFRFVEYDSHVVKDEETYHLKIKDSEGEIHTFYAENTNKGQINIRSYNIKDFKAILQKGGIIAVSAETEEYSKSKYLFRMDVTGYENAKEYISPLNNPMTKIYKQENENFLKENAKNNDIKTTPNGLQYKIIKQGDGAIPTMTDKVKIHYRGRLIDDTEFDNSYIFNRPRIFKVNQVIKGLAEALTIMPVGSKWEIYIPQELAYEDQERDQIKPFSTLIFNLELLGIEN